MTAERSTVEVELNALNHIIFGSLYDFEITTLEFVIKVVLGNFFPFDNRNLTVRDNISFCGFDFFKGIVCAYKHILEHSHTAFVGSGIEVNTLSRSGLAVKVELNALIHIIFGSLDNLQIATLENVLKAHRSRLSTHDRYSLRLLRLIIIDGLLCNGVSAGTKVINDNLAVRTRLYGLVHTVSGNGKGNARHITVLRGLNDFGRTQADLDIEITPHGIVYFCGKGRQVLLTTTGCIHTVRPNNNTLTNRTVLCSGNAYFTRRCFICGDSQLVSANREADTRLTCGKRIITQHVVCVGECSGIVCTVPLKFNILSLRSRLRKEARYFGVLLHVGNDTVVAADILTVKRVVLAYTVVYCIIAARINVVKVAVTLTDNRFPNKSLCCHNVSHLIRIGGVLRTPINIYRSGVTVLKDTTDEQLDLVSRNGLVVG